MKKKLPLYVVREVSRHGKVKYYYRRGKGIRVRLPDDIRSKDFHTAYIAAASGTFTHKRETSSAPPNSLRWLVDHYRESAKWKGYSKTTQLQQERFFLEAIENSGNADCRTIGRRSINAAVSARADRPGLANNFLKAMKALFSWAHANEYVETNPTDGIANMRYKSEGFKAWTIADYKQFCDYWHIGTKPRLACELLLQTGLRRSDIVSAGKKNMVGKIFTMRTAKTGAVITVEFPETLMAIIEATPTGDDTFMVTDFGKPFVKEGFTNWFREKCREAGLQLNTHGLRKLSATLSANAGAAAHELMAQYGWSNIKQAEVYTKRADRIALGIRNSRRISDQIENELSRDTMSTAQKKDPKNNEY